MFDRQFDGVAKTPDQVPIINFFGKTFRDMLLNISGRPQLEVYTNFAHGDEGAVAWYSAANVPTLRALKKIYDPDSLFSFYNSVNAN
jgi:fumiquinazoline A oxidase